MKFTYVDSKESISNSLLILWDKRYTVATASLVDDGSFLHQKLS